MPWPWTLSKILAPLTRAARRLGRAPEGVRLSVTPLVRQYVGEEIAGNAIWGGSQVRYLTEAERAPYALTLRDGRIWDAGGALFDTSNAETLFSNLGRAIFVTDADGVFYASKRQAIGEFHHSSLVAGGPVAAAGELEVVNGRLTAISDKSGHYRPRRSHTAQAIDRLRKNNISLQGVTFDLIGRP